jgi:prophage DNA circulation protein
VPFGVLSSDGHFGRRQALHEYPFRDTPWIEDMGRSARKISLVGFLVENDPILGVGDVIAQRDRMIAACETAGQGSLIHPTLGALTVSLLDPVVISERWDEGRYFELGFSFGETGSRQFPDLSGATGGLVTDAAAAADAAAASDFASRANTALRQGAAVVKQAVGTAAIWARTAQRLVNTATNLYHAAGTLQGNFGRFFGGRNQGFGAKTTAVQSASVSVGSLIAQGTAARANVASAANALNAAAGGLGL